jgi:hypothetical protein
MIGGNDVAFLLAFMAAAIALAGFAGIVTSIDRRTVGATSEVISYRVRALTVAALFSIFLAALPLLFEALAIAPTTLWQFVCIFSASAIALLSIVVFVSRRRMAGVDKGFSQPVFVTSMIFGAVVVGAGILGAGGFMPARGAYYLGQFFLLYQTYMLFYRMVLLADEASRVASGKQ